MARDVIDFDLQRRSRKVGLPRSVPMDGPTGRIFKAAHDAICGAMPKDELLDLQDQEQIKEGLSRYLKRRGKQVGAAYLRELADKIDPRGSVEF
jgi:hypothetical protein